MPAFLLIIWAIWLFVGIIFTATLFYLIRKKNLKLAVLSSLASVLGFVWFWPIPGHGSFMFLGAEFIRELKKSEFATANRFDSMVEPKSAHRFGDRFAGRLNYQPNVQPAKNWQQIAYDNGRSALLDHKAGLIWSQWLLLPVSGSLPTLETAKSFCSNHPPSGFWSLATESEFIIMQQNGGDSLLPPPATSSMSYTIDDGFNMELPNYQVAGGDNFNPAGERQFSVRCVALGPGGPDNGYSKSDIPLKEWNSYQLSKLKPKN